MKKRFLRILSSLLVVVMIVGSAPLSGFVGLDLPNWSDLFTIKADAATYSGTCGANLTWSLDTETGVLEISGTGDMNNWGYYSYVPWYSNCSSIKTVVIGDSVTCIGNWAFGYCKSLTSVTIPDSVTSIGRYAFYNCKSLTRVTIPDSVTSIGELAFCYCTGLTSVTIPDSVTSIGEYAFEDCKSLTSVTIGNSVTSIGNGAFSNCYRLTRVYITDIAAWCGISFEDSYANPLYYAKNLYLNNELVTDLVIPNGVTSIGDYAFYYCTRLTSVTIPDSVTSIGDRAFSDCTSLTSVTIPNSVTRIGNSAFYYCTSLTSVIIGDSVTSIRDYAFYYCKSLTDVYYTGTEAEWNKISIGIYNDDLLNATIHYSWVCPHNSYTEHTTPATCITDGESYKLCNDCGVKFDVTTIPATGNHTIVIVEAVTPTCTETGLTAGAKCSVCGEIYIEQTVVDALGHTEEIIPGKAQTETENGLTDGIKCSVCGVVLKEQEVIPAGTSTLSGIIETFDDGVDNDDTTTIELFAKDTGTRTYTITVEGTGKKEYSINSIKYGTYIVSVSKQNHATREYTIEVGKEDVTLDMKLHLLGDIDGDGFVKINDLSRINANIKETKLLDDYQIACADVNGDGDIRMNDLSLVNAHIKEMKPLW